MEDKEEERKRYENGDDNPHWIAAFGAIASAFVPFLGIVIGGYFLNHEKAINRKMGGLAIAVGIIMVIIKYF